MAREMIDIKMDGDGDLDFTGGDLNFVESTAAHQEDLILSGKGDFKEFPTVGVDAFSYLDGEGFGDLMNEISAQFSQDGMQVNSLKMGSDGVIKSDAFYK